jgi:serine/threonine-protein kinase
VVHRDIKPANIFLDQRGRVKVGDFGIARLEGSELTQTGMGLGTPGYLAPELLRGAAADARSDLFALGVVAYQLLTGTKPFAHPRVADGGGGEPTEVLPPHVLRGEIPEEASRAVMRCLSEQPTRRPESSAAFLKELRVQGANREATVTVVAPTVEPGIDRRTVILGATALALGSLGGFVWFSNRGIPLASASPSPPATTPTQTAPKPATPRPTTAPTTSPAPTPSAAPRHGPRNKPVPGHGKGRGKGNKKKGD